MSSSNANANTWASRLFSTETQTTGITDKAVAIATMQESDESNSTLGADIWYRCSLQLQKDRDVALVAVKMRCIPADVLEWPTELKHDIEFWNALLLHQGKCRYDDHSASSNGAKPETNHWYVPVWKSESQILSVLHSLPSLAGNVNFWYTVLQSNYVSSDILIDKAHPTILSNKQFMIHAIQSNFTVYDALCAPLNQDEDVVVAALQQHADAIIYIPAFIQDLYPNAVAESIRNYIDFSPKNSEQRHHKFRQFKFAEYLSSRSWRNRDVAMAWVSVGGPYRYKDFPFEFECDEEIFLLLAKHHPDDFEYISHTLLSDKEFMKKAIAINGLVFNNTVFDDDFNYDLDLAVISFSDSVEVLDSFKGDYGFRDDFFLPCYEYLSDKKLQHESFFLFATAVSIVHPHNQNTSNALVILNQGAETTIMILKLIHEFLGAPKGIDLQRIQIAHSNCVEYFREQKMFNF